MTMVLVLVNIMDQEAQQCTWEWVSKELEGAALGDERVVAIH
jgi:hypothetical protein